MIIVLRLLIKVELCLIFFICLESIFDPPLELGYMETLTIPIQFSVHNCIYQFPEVSNKIPPISLFIKALYFQANHSLYNESGVSCIQGRNNNTTVNFKKGKSNEDNTELEIPFPMWNAIIPPFEIESNLAVFNFNLF